MKRSFADKISEGIISTILVILAILALYPLWYVFMYSLSDPGQSTLGGLYLVPRGGIHLTTYIKVLSTEMIYRAYSNTLFVVIVGTCVNITLTVLTAYSLSKKDLKGQKAIMLAIMFTMLFNGGMIPTFLVVKSVGLMNNLWALIIPTAIRVYYLLIMISFFKQIPESIEESARIDGCSIPGILTRIILPLSVPALATLTLFYSVDHWNDFHQCIIYISDSKKHVLQLVLRNLLMAGDNTYMDNISSAAEDITPESLKMATVMVATIPILAVYPFIQKYFVKGVTLGAVKG